MASFKDRGGREWPLVITFADVEKLDAQGISIETLDFLSTGDVLYRSRKLAEVLWMLASKDVPGASREEFAAGLDCEALDRGAAALMEAIVDFTHRRQSAPVKAKLPELMAAMDRARSEAIGLALSSGAGTLPASSESTPAP